MWTAPTVAAADYRLDMGGGIGGRREPGRPVVEIRRSTRRRRTVSAYQDGDTLVVMVPATLTRSEEAACVERLLQRLDRRTSRSRSSDAELTTRARELSRRYLEGLAIPSSVRWVGNQNARWGSCTVSDGSIRLSSRLRGMPEWVVDYVLLHELTHLLVPAHGPPFWAWVDRFPAAQRARGYLEGVAAAAGLELADDTDVAT